MNRKRRKKLAEALSKLEESLQALTDIRDEEEDAFDNMPESLQDSERGSKMEETIEALNDACCEIEDHVRAIEDMLSS